MRKVGIVLASALALAATAAPAAGAAAPGQVCETVNFLVVKYTGGLGMHIPVVEDAWHQVCAVTP